MDFLRKMNMFLDESILLYGEKKDLSVYEFNMLRDLIDLINSQEDCEKIWVEFSKKIQSKFIFKGSNLIEVFIDKKTFSMKAITRMGNIVNKARPFDKIFNKDKFSMKDFHIKLSEFCIERFDETSF